jgi:hypothetical protein
MFKLVQTRVLIIEPHVAKYIMIYILIEPQGCIQGRVLNEAEAVIE